MDYVQSRSYRAPEVFLGHKYDCRIDIWSLGAVLAELFSGYVLFQSNSQTAWLGKIAGVVGPFSETFLAEGKNSSLHFTHSGVLFEQQEDSSYNLIYSKKTTLAQRMHLTKEIEASPQGDEALFIDFLRTLLQINWRERPTATQALSHPWLIGALENDVTYDPL